MNDQYEKILKRLAHARKAAGLTQVQAGNLINLTPSTISHVEGGQRALDVERLLQMCEIYRVSVVWVMTGVNPNFDQEKRQAAFDALVSRTKASIEEITDLLDDMEMWMNEDADK